MINVYEKIATGTKAVGLKAIKVAGVIDKTCSVIAYHATDRQVRALERKNKRIAHIAISLEMRKVRNNKKIEELSKYLRWLE